MVKNPRDVFHENFGFAENFRIDLLKNVFYILPIHAVDYFVSVVDVSASKWLCLDEIVFDAELRGNFLHCTFHKLIYSRGDV